MTRLKEKTVPATTEELASVVKRLGSPVSTILLHAPLPCDIFRIPEVDGVIGYHLVKHCAIVMGDPICLPEDVPQLSQAFYHYCQERNWRIVYALVSSSFAHWAINNGYHTLIQAAEELILNPTTFEKRQKLRWKVNQSLQHGVVVKEYTDHDPVLENQMNATIKAWLKAKHGPQVHLGSLDTFVTGTNRRIFYAIHNNQMVGLLKIIPIDRFQGWTMNSFLAIPEAPIGTSEHLMSFVCDTLANEQCQFLCLGAISGTQLGEIVGMNFFSKFLARLIFDISRSIFKLDAKRNYLNKYHPKLSLDYFIFSGKLSFNELLAIKQILNVKLC